MGKWQHGGYDADWNEKRRLCPHHAKFHCICCDYVACVLLANEDVMEGLCAVCQAKCKPGLQAFYDLLEKVRLMEETKLIV